MKKLFLILISGLIFTALPLFAQHNNRASRDLQFRFGNPGARSLGFGGAFIGLADDATAPLANPAGMVLTRKRSVSYEFDYSTHDNEILFQSGTVLQTNLFEFDFALNTSTAKEQTFSIPYLAMVMPMKGMHLGFFIHQQANLKRQYTTDPILICPFASGFHPDCANDPQPSFYPQSTDTLDIQMFNGGVSLAREFGNRFSMGLSAFYSRMDYQADSSTLFPLVTRDEFVNRTARGKDSGWGGIAGLLWRATDNLSIGATYKHQPEFNYRAISSSTGPIPLNPPDFEADGIFNVPDSLGIGFSIKPLDVFTINFDANRVYYSQITDDFIDFTRASLDNDTPILQFMPDVTELHIGMEYIFFAAFPISVRAGYWVDPYHAATNNIEDNQILEGPLDKPFFRDVFFLNRFERDINHYSLGLGLTPRNNIQLDFAMEIADDGDRATFSGIYRF